jgi:hypothetical protein
MTNFLREVNYSRSPTTLIKSRSPVPAGSRVTFFAGPKKVTKERTCAALGISVAWIRANQQAALPGNSTLLSGT